ncbi:outer membrane beta-barrel protein [Cupriavidus basilensis]|uniref:outer membrane beta-barrel protein n=1 Tax=Cupriavidus basilensis TaxID=68895 RepID=UPI0023E7A8EB|nr:outer membrane beta-barrel protein [Cupriavidus basilensis]MDF3881007.1 outer membrane beta-barrel protein [Cupriavidus basilensis]
MKRSVYVCAATALTLLSASSIAAWAESQGPEPAAGASVSPTVQASAPQLQPAIATTLSANPEATSFNPGGLGPIYVTGVASGLAQVQSNALPSDRSRQLDIGNAQVFINKPDGLLQFFLQAGYYSIPVLGAPYIRAADATPTFFSPVAQGYLKIAPAENFSVMVGKLPTLIGAESTFSFQNMNIERGLLWNQENAVNRGVQVNFAAGPLTLAASVNDGFYSNRYSWVSISASYALDSANTLAVIAGGNTSHTDVSTTATPLFQNNQQIYNLIYTHTEGPWTFQPYLQYTRVPKLEQFGAYECASTYGGALLMSYDFGAKAVPAALRVVGFKLPVRLEYIGSTGSAAGGAPNLLYGPGSAAWSFTVTPTYQYKRFFARAEFSYVGARKTAPGLAFGTDGNNRSQARGLLEVGLLL